MKYNITERRRVEEALHASRRFIQSSLDALSANIVILDADGVIVGLNGAWHRFAQDNRMSWPDHGLGRNYLDVLDRIKGDDAETARKAVAGIRSVMATDLDYFEMEYACHSPAEERAEQIDGVLTIQSAPGDGVTIKFEATR